MDLALGREDTPGSSLLRIRHLPGHDSAGSILSHDLWGILSPSILDGG